MFFSQLKLNVLTEKTYDLCGALLDFSASTPWSLNSLSPQSKEMFLHQI